MSGTHTRKKRRMDTSGDFNLVVVGCGGGHDETNLSGYLLKPKDKPWSAGLLSLEAGSGYGALKRLLSTTHPHLFSSLFAPPNTKSSKLPPPSHDSATLSPTDKAYTVFSYLRAYLLTHAHLDHAASLIISSGSLPGPARYILGARGVLEDLEQCIWGPGRCWPNIVGWEHEASEAVNENEHDRVGPKDVGSGSGPKADVNTAGGILRSLKVAASLPGDPIGDRDEEYTPIGLGMDEVFVRVVPVSHGCGPSRRSYPQNKVIPCSDGHNGHPPNAEEVYRSSAFFVRHGRTRHEFLFFGDVEADPVSPSSTSNTSTPQPVLGPSRPLLLPIWQHAAHLFTSNRLRTLLIECSYPAGRPEAQLFGHLSVERLRKEMRVLAQEVVKLRKLDRTPKEENMGHLLNGEIPSEPADEDVKPRMVSVRPTAPRRSRRTHTHIEHPNQPHPTKGSKRKAGSGPSSTSTQTQRRQPQALGPSTSAPDIPTSTNVERNLSMDPLNDALTGLRVIVIHCKEPAPGFDLAGAPTIADFIVRQLKEGAAGSNKVVLGPDELGVEYVAAHQGDEFGESSVNIASLFQLGRAASTHVIMMGIRVCAAGWRMRGFGWRGFKFESVATNLWHKDAMQTRNS